MTINCKGNLISLENSKVMGILNLTPDSFYDGGKYKNEREIFTQIEKMLHQGADFIDVGAYSSRPDALHISEDEELKRIVPVVEKLIKQFPDILLSVDTFRAKVAKKTILAGAAIVNDIAAGNMDKAMLPTVAKLNVPYVMMHMKGTPQTMKQQTHYNKLVEEIVYYFSEKTAEAKQAGINDIIIDPGFGFSKTINQNFELLKNLALFKNLDYPILAGVSRKSMIYKTLQTTPQEALNGTSVLNTIALLNGARILRVHDVKEAKECILLTQQLTN